MSNRNGNRATRERERLDFAKIKTTVQIPNLIDVQKKSYQRFLQMDLLPSEREDTGLQSVFTSVFPIQDFRGLRSLISWTTQSATGSASADICAGYITFAQPAGIAALR